MLQICRLWEEKSALSLQLMSDVILLNKLCFYNVNLLINLNTYKFLTQFILFRYNVSHPSNKKMRLHSDILKNNHKQKFVAFIWM